MSKSTVSTIKAVVLIIIGIHLLLASFLIMGVPQFSILFGLSIGFLGSGIVIIVADRKYPIR